MCVPSHLSLLYLCFLTHQYRSDDKLVQHVLNIHADLSHFACMSVCDFFLVVHGSVVGCAATLNFLYIRFPMKRDIRYFIFCISGSSIYCDRFPKVSTLFSSIYKETCVHRLCCRNLFQNKTTIDLNNTSNCI